MNYVKKNDDLLLSKETNRIKFWVKQTLLRDHLPVLPNSVEEKLFIEGRTAWTYKYSNIKIKINKKSKTAVFSVSAKLKMEFHIFSEIHQFHFNVTCKYYLEDEKVKIIKLEPK